MRYFFVFLLLFPCCYGFYTQEIHPEDFHEVLNVVFHCDGYIRKYNESLETTIILAYLCDTNFSTSIVDIEKNVKQQKMGYLHVVERKLYRFRWFHQVFYIKTSKTKEELSTFVKKEGYRIFERLSKRMDEMKKMHPFLVILGTIVLAYMTCYFFC